MIYGMVPQPDKPPLPEDGTEAARIQESRRRRAMLEGTWRELLRERIRVAVGSVRARAWGLESIAVNPFRSIVRELAVLYDAEPIVTHPRLESSEAFADALRKSGLWSMMPQLQRSTVALRESLIRVSTNSRGQLRYRIAYADMVRAWADMDNPSQPHTVWEYRLRKLDGKKIWTVDVLSVRDPEAPVYKVCGLGKGASPNEALDYTEHFLGQQWSGEAYPYRMGGEDKRPILPYVMYHGSHNTDRLWDPYEGIELVESSLDLAVIGNMILHVFRQASWPQRYAINLQPAGMDLIDDNETRRHEVVTDPSTLLLLESPVRDESTGQPMIGQFQPGADVEKLESSFGSMLARVASDAGVPPSDIQRMGGTARSGYAISLTNEGKRKQQRAYAEVFRPSDERLMSVSAVLLNRANGLNFPEGGWTVVYRETALSPDEMEARRKHALELVEAGLQAKPEAYQFIFPGTSREEAVRQIAAAEGIDLSDSAAAISAVAESIEAALSAVMAGDDSALLAALRAAKTGLNGSISTKDD